MPVSRSERQRPGLRSSRVAIVVQVLVGLFALALVVFAVVANDAWFQVHMMRRYCVVDPAALGRAHAGRWAVGVLALVAFAIARPRLGRWAALRSPASLAGGMLRMLGAVVLALIVTDVVLRVWGKKPSPPAVRFESGQREPATWDVEMDRKVHHAVNKDGLRSRTQDDAPDTEAPTILFSGESVVWGHGVNFDETIPAMVAAHAGVQTVNLGVRGFGNDDALAWLERWLPRFKRPVAVVSFVIYNQLFRNVLPGPTRLVLGPNGALEKAPPPSWSPLQSSPLFAVLRAAVPYGNDDAVDLTRAILRRTAELARARGAYPLFVLTQCGARCLDTSADGPWLAARLVEGQPFRSIRIELDASLEIPGDGHPGPRANERYAAAIERALQDAGLL